MNVQEIIAEIPKFSLEDRLAILESVTRSLRDEPRETGKQGSSASRLRGLSKPAEGLPEDFDWKKIKEEYLTEKYL